MKPRVQVGRLHSDVDASAVGFNIDCACANGFVSVIARAVRRAVISWDDRSLIDVAQSACPKMG